MTIFQKTKAIPFLIAGVYNMDHIGGVAAESVHFGADEW